MNIDKPKISTNLEEINDVNNLISKSITEETDIENKLFSSAFESDIKCPKIEFKGCKFYNSRFLSCIPIFHICFSNLP